MKKTICLDISGGVLRCAEIGFSRKAVLLQKGFSLPDAPLPERDVPDADFTAAYRKAMQDAGMNGKNAVLYLHAPEIVHRTVPLPAVPRKDLLRYLRLNSADYFPVPLEEKILDVTLEHAPDGDRLSVYIVPQQTVQNARAFLKALGLTAVGFALSLPVEQTSAPRVCVSYFGIEAHIQASENGEIFLDRRESVGQDALRMALLRTEDALRERIADAEVHVFAPEAKRQECVRQIRDVFGAEVSAEVNALQEVYGDLSALPSAVCSLREDALHVSGRKTQGDIRADRLLLFGILLLVCTFVLSAVFLFHRPQARLAAAKQALAQMPTVPAQYSSEAQMPRTDTYNDYFAYFITQLRQKLPSSCTIESLTVQEKSARLTISVPSKAVGAVAVNTLDTLTIAKLKTVSAVTRTSGTYRFTAQLAYTDALLREGSGQE